MSALHSLSPRNRLLAGLSAEDLALLQPHLEQVSLQLREIVIEPGVPVEHVYFVEEGLVSLIAQTDHGRIEVGMIGPEGLAGVSAVLDSGRSALAGLVQADGTALRMPAEQLRMLVRQSPTLFDGILRYVQYLLTLTAQTAYANASFGVEARLARWILMTQDRLKTDDLPLTHEFLSMMLGTRRSSVTTATHVLEGNGLIRASRGIITVRDREKLEELAGDAYGLAEAEYERLFGSA